MKKILFVLTMSLALALGTHTASAQAKKKATAAAAEAVDAAKGKAEEATGAAKEKGKAAADRPIPMYVRADEIDASGKTFTQVNKDGSKAKHVVTASTTIMNGEKAATLGDIKVGEYVSGLRKKSADGSYEVVKITKFGPKAAKPAAKEGEAKPKAK